MIPPESMPDRRKTEPKFIVSIKVEDEYLANELATALEKAYEDLSHKYNEMFRADVSVQPLR